jgi:hypothetical protein
MWGFPPTFISKKDGSTKEPLKDPDHSAEVLRSFLG